MPSSRVIRDGGPGGSYSQSGPEIFGYGDAFPTYLKASGAQDDPPDGLLFNRTDLGAVFRFDRGTRGWIRSTDKNAVTPFFLRYDVTSYGATGNGTTDDTAAIQRTIAAIPSTGGRIYFPDGKYVVSSTIDLSGLGWFRLEGSGFVVGSISVGAGSVIAGNFSGDLLKYVPLSGGSGHTFVIDGVTLSNSHASGVAFHCENFGQSLMINSQFRAGSIGVNNPSNSFGTCIKNCKFDGQSNIGIGAVLSGHGSVENCDVIGWDIGIRISGVAVNLLSNRSEVNKTAFQIGVSPAGATLAAQGCLIAGNRFEANDVSLEVRSVNACLFSGLHAQGSAVAPSGQSVNGITVAFAQVTTFQGVVMGGSYSDAAIKVTSGSGTKLSFVNCSAANSLSGKKAWDIQTDLTNLSFYNCDYILRPDDTQTQSWLARSPRLSSFGAINNLLPAVEGKNVTQRDVPVTQTATTLAVVFTAGGHAPGFSTINTATATAGAGLPDGTYFVLATAVTARGEGTGINEKTVVCSGGNNQITVTYSAMTADGFKRRTYIGTSTGVYVGYFESALNSNANLVITSLTCDGFKSPPISGVDPTDMREPDANYAVQVTPNWGTTVFVTSKATTGFTINFGTQAPASATVDWMIVR